MVCSPPASITRKTCVLVLALCELRTNLELLVVEVDHTHVSCLSDDVKSNSFGEHIKITARKGGNCCSRPKPTIQFVHGWLFAGTQGCVVNAWRIVTLHAEFILCATMITPSLTESLC